MKDFDEWNEIKKQVEEEEILFGFKTRDIFNIKMGQNIGFEQNGKGENFVRPVLVYKKLTKDMFIVFHLQQHKEMEVFSLNLYL